MEGLTMYARYDMLHITFRYENGSHITNCIQALTHYNGISVLRRTIQRPPFDRRSIHACVKGNEITGSGKVYIFSLGFGTNTNRAIRLRLVRFLEVRMNADQWLAKGLGQLLAATDLTLSRQPRPALVDALLTATEARMRAKLLRGYNTAALSVLERLISFFGDQPSVSLAALRNEAQTVHAAMVQRG